MNVPEFLQLPEPVSSVDDAIVNDGYFPDLSQAEFEKNYQVTDVFKGKTRYLLESARVLTNNGLSHATGKATLDETLHTTYRMCVYANAMVMICQRKGSVDTQTKSEFEGEKKTTLALVYANEFRRLLIILNGGSNEMTCDLI